MINMKLSFFDSKVEYITTSKGNKVEQPIATMLLDLLDVDLNNQTDVYAFNKRYDIDLDLLEKDRVQELQETYNILVNACLLQDCKDMPDKLPSDRLVAFKFNTATYKPSKKLMESLNYLLSESFTTGINFTYHPSHAMMLEYVINSIEDLLFLSFNNLLTSNIFVKRCKCCSKLFPMTGSKKAVYCIRLGNKGTTCRLNGPQRTYSTHDINSIETTYRRMYSHLYQDYAKKRITREQLDNWMEEASIQKLKFKTGAITIDDFKQWHNEKEVELGVN